MTRRGVTELPAAVSAALELPARTDAASTPAPPGPPGTARRARSHPGLHDRGAIGARATLRLLLPGHTHGSDGSTRVGTAADAAAASAIPAAAAAANQATGASAAGPAVAATSERATHSRATAAATARTESANVGTARGPAVWGSARAAAIIAASLTAVRFARGAALAVGGASRARRGPLRGARVATPRSATWTSACGVAVAPFRCGQLGGRRHMPEKILVVGREQAARGDSHQRDAAELPDCAVLARHTSPSPARHASPLRHGAQNHRPGGRPITGYSCALPSAGRENYPGAGRLGAKGVVVMVQDRFVNRGAG